MPKVRSGLDVLAGEDFERLAGRRIGLMALPSSKTFDGRSILDALLACGQVTVAALFALQPDSYGVEHDLNTDTFEPRTGAPLYSLSAARPRPTAEMLRALDVVVIDVPDSGVRFNPHLSRVAAMLQECARRNVPVLVLDRPNPLGGLVCDGAYPAPGLLAGEWAPYPMPIVHGLTMGELARLLNDVFGLQGRVEVAECTGWKRYWTFDRTELPWCAPSPELGSFEVCALFAGVSLAAPANVSVGLGTDRPFTMIGAPYMNSEVLTAEFAKRPLPGVEVEAVSFTPAAAAGSRPGVPAVFALPGAPVFVPDAPWAFAGQTCRGVAFRISDVEAYQPVKFGVQVLHTLAKLYPDELKLERTVYTLGRPEVPLMIRNGLALDKIFASWSADRLDFNSVRLECLLY
ncbi:MAG: DUF1343 domain-containing protein [Candidatus Sumerlaeia bacterium]